MMPVKPLNKGHLESLFKRINSASLIPQMTFKGQMCPTFRHSEVAFTENVLHFPLEVLLYSAKQATKVTGL